MSADTATVEDVMPGFDRLMTVARDWHMLTEDTRDAVLDGLTPDHQALLQLMILGWDQGRCLMHREVWTMPERLTDPATGELGIAAVRLLAAHHLTMGMLMPGYVDEAQEGWLPPCLP
ncbi:hypothetical protein KIH27_02075 [Mycobacterium sp. M1]|uniref:Uncharacterized protein n=1 Tax=Mycolicibacter acidiphilus TaxID=2835306 RepID=A0ABS5RDL0_9MYCO|nr:hypothetical protein [Mycolicibacter acidiphilus]MBS9532372.1 hypothetical protein [Mycolicibacter acidiphilus]